MQSLCRSPEAGGYAGVWVSVGLSPRGGRIRPHTGVSCGWGSRSRFCRCSHVSNKLIQNPGSHPARNWDLEPKVILGPSCHQGRS